MLQPPAKRRRRRKNGPLIDGDLATYPVLTANKVFSPDHTTKEKTILVPLGPLIPEASSSHAEPAPLPQPQSKLTQPPSWNHDQDYDLPPPCAEEPRPKKTKTQRDYMQEFVDQIPGLLQASLSREYWHEEQRHCSHCDTGKLAIWRCIDCSLARPICRKCMRHEHQHSPFHRIECWTGLHFRRAALWEVGTYILVQHSIGPGICVPMKFRIDYLEAQQQHQDAEEQVRVSTMPTMAPKSDVHPTQVDAWEDPAPTKSQPAPQPAPTESQTAPMGPESDDVEMQYHVYPTHGETWEEERVADADFYQWLETGHETESQHQYEGADDHSANAAEADIEGFDQYLGPVVDVAATSTVDDWTGPEGNISGSANMDGTGDLPTRPSADALNNSYVRIVHTNGVHHMAMVSCSCHGQNQIPLDLVASRLMPASFKRIRTLFTTGLLDYFRLCNLELKASAYQFYQLLRRLTLPLGHTEMVNLYHEFRRMSRLWRYLKKLKWAGYGHNKKDPSKAEAGSLANFCPTCPQPTVNLPGAWKDDQNR